MFVDDRVPCTPSGVPCFCDSSDPFEAWPLLLEKAFAKYLGSYGHVAVYSSRLDSSLTALRLLTGTSSLQIFHSVALPTLLPHTSNPILSAKCMEIER